MAGIEESVINILNITLQVFIPICLAAIGGTISERSGVINLGLEGMMLIGAFSAAFGSYITGNAYIGVLISVIVCAVLGSVYGFFCVNLKANQSVIGVGVNMLAAGITAVLLKLIWGNEGMSEIVSTIKNVSVPVLNKIPFLRVFFDNQSVFLYVTIFIGVLSYIVIYKSKIGLRLRAIGDNPRSAQTAGININKYKYIAIIFSSVIAGLGGSYLSVSLNNLFVKDMVAGRGFMGLAANIFGGWHPIGSIVSSFIFSLAQALRFNLTELNIPNQFIEMIPYVVTLLVLILARRKSKSPEALGKNI